MAATGPNSADPRVRPSVATISASANRIAGKRSGLRSNDVSATDTDRRQEGGCLVCRDLGESLGRARPGVRWRAPAFRAMVTTRDRGRETLSTTVVPRLRGLEAWRWYLRFYANPLRCLNEARRQLGPMIVFENNLPGPQAGARYVMISGGALNREVLGRPADFRPSGLVLNGPPGSALRRLRNGLFQMSGETHRRHRRLMRPSFSTTSVGSTIPSMAPLIDRIIDRWKIGETLDVLQEMRTLSNWVAAKVLFGSEDFEASLHVGSLIDRLASLDAKRRRWGMLEFNLPGTPYRRELQHAELLEKTMLDLIEQKRRSGSLGDDVLSLLIRAKDSGSGMSDSDLVAHSVALYGASFETTASAIAWTLFLVAQHPKFAIRLLDELNDGLDAWPPDPRKLEELPLLDAAVMESMRVLPPVPVTLRRVVGHVELEGVKLEPGNKIIFSQFPTHRDPEVFPEPERFDPSRWLRRRPDPYEYIPFSVGPRVCLGAFFAVTEIKLSVARILQKYRLTVVPGTKIDPVLDFVLKPQGGLPMTIHAQDRAFTRSPVTGNIGQAVDLVSPEIEPIAAGVHTPSARREEERAPVEA